MRSVVGFGVGGMASVAITRTELDSTGLRAAAAGSSDAKQARRLLALAMVLDGHPRSLAAQAGGMDRQTLRDWVHRYNEHGVAGLRDVRNKGRAPALSAEQMQELEGLVLAGPDLKRDGVDPHRLIPSRIGINAPIPLIPAPRWLERQDGLRKQTGTNLLPRPGLERHQANPCNNIGSAAINRLGWRRGRDCIASPTRQDRCG